MEKGFNQLDYTQPLGLGHGGTIHDIGCDLCSHASECVNAGHNTEPVQLNQDLDNNGGYAIDSNGNYDELIPSVISKIYPDMSLAFDNNYPTIPADMNLIDSQLEKGVGVIVGVSYQNDPNQTQPDHFVRIYKKNQDGTYQCFDPCPKSGLDSDVDSNFNTRYAVNGVAQAILQAESFNYTLPQAGTYVDAATFDKLVHNSEVSDSLNDFVGLPHNSDWQTIQPKIVLASSYESLKSDRDKQAVRAGWYDQLCLKYGFTGDTSSYNVDELANLIETTWQGKIDDVQRQFDEYKMSHPDTLQNATMQIPQHVTGTTTPSTVASSSVIQKTSVLSNKPVLPKNIWQRLLIFIKYW